MLIKLEQELIFEAAEKACRLYAVDFSPEKYRTAGIAQKKDGIYTNLALTLSDQCAYRKTRTFAVTKQMRDLGLIQLVGRGESKYYTINQLFNCIVSPLSVNCNCGETKRIVIPEHMLYI